MLFAQLASTNVLIPRKYVRELFHMIIGRRIFLYKFIVTQMFFATVMLLRCLKQVFWSPYFMSAISTITLQCWEYQRSKLNFYFLNFLNKFVFLNAFYTFTILRTFTPNEYCKQFLQYSFGVNVLHISQ